VVLVASRAALQVFAHPGQTRVGVRAGQLEFDVLVEELEALLAADLGVARPQQPRDEFPVSVVRATLHLPCFSARGTERRHSAVWPNERWPS
jgi:hypothetical protein